MAVLTNNIKKGTFYTLGQNGYEKLCPYANEVYMQDGTTVEDKVSGLSFEYGKSGDWYYRKWNNGVLECWAIKGGTTTGSGAFHSTTTFPVNFVENPSVTASAWVPGDINARVGYINTSNKDIEWYVHGFGNSSASIRLFVIGRWK